MGSKKYSGRYNIFSRQLELRFRKFNYPLHLKNNFLKFNA